MIAPIRHLEDDTLQQPAVSRTARQIAAEMLPKPVREDDDLPPVPAWQAWLLVGWMVITSLTFLAFMLGLVAG